MSKAYDPPRESSSRDTAFYPPSFEKINHFRMNIIDYYKLLESMMTICDAFTNIHNIAKAMMEIF